MTTVFGQEKFSTRNSVENALAFMIDQAINRINVCTPVKVVAVHTTGRTSAVGTVDVTPLIDQQTIEGIPVEHTTIFGVPFVRMQTGSSAMILDPQAGDIGICIFADRDISSFKQTGKEGVPPTFRKYDMADGIYIGGWNKGVTPSRWVVMDDAGISIESDNITETAQSLITTITGTWQQILANVQAQADTFEITVPEFTINGNLHVTGLVHCTWQGSLIDVKYGGTGADLSVTGGPNMVLAQLTPGAPVTVVPVGSLSPGDEYTNLTPTPVTLGGIPAGSTFNTQTMTQMWNALLYPYQAPTFTSFAITGQTSPLEVGDTSLANPTFTWAMANPTNALPNTVSIHDITASVTLVTGHSNASPYAATYAGVTKTTAGQEVFQISATNSNSVVFSDNYAITWDWRIHYGHSPSTALTSANVVALGAGGLQTGFAGTYVFPAAASEYKIFSYPTSFGTATLFKDATTGFAVPFNAPYVVAVTNAFGITTNYNVHQSTYQLGGAVTMVIS